MLDTTPMREFIDLSFGAEMQQLREEIALWIKRSDVEMHETLEWQFVANSKYFRPLTVFSSYRAMQGGAIPPSIIRGALLIELFHNVSLVIDDIVDHSEYRRDKATLYKKFGELQALMASGYIVADAYCMAAEDIGAITLLSELMKRLAVAECMQWRLRRQPS